MIYFDVIFIKNCYRNDASVKYILNMKKYLKYTQQVMSFLKSKYGASINCNKIIWNGKNK